MLEDVRRCGRCECPPTQHYSNSQVEDVDGRSLKGKPYSQETLKCHGQCIFRERMTHTICAKCKVHLEQKLFKVLILLRFSAISKILLQGSVTRAVGHKDTATTLNAHLQGNHAVRKRQVLIVEDLRKLPHEFLTALQVNAFDAGGHMLQVPTFFPWFASLRFWAVGPRHQASMGHLCALPRALRMKCLAICGFVSSGRSFLRAVRCEVSTHGDLLAARWTCMNEHGASATVPMRECKIM